MENKTAATADNETVTFAELSVDSFFTLPLDPQQRPLFKLGPRGAQDMQYRLLCIAGQEPVIPKKP